ncbi:hypothetical protein D3C86_2190930 [compost metagenome]
MHYPRLVEVILISEPIAPALATNQSVSVLPAMVAPAAPVEIVPSVFEAKTF